MKVFFFIIATSINQPKFCSSASWNSTGITFADSSLIGTSPNGISVNINNTVYVTNQQFSLIQVWFEGNMTPTTINIINNIYPYSLFVTILDDIYIDNAYGVIKQTLNMVNIDIVLTTGARCYGLFIDKNNSLHCSVYSSHMVVKRSLNDNNTLPVTVTGVGCSGFLPNMLYNP